MTQVTIIIPAYNSMQYLPATLKSVFKQTYQDFEIVVVNDGSTDGTEKYISSLNEPRLRVISQTNQGASAARNKGIIDAKGKYIAFLDADDLWSATKLEKQVSCLENQAEVGLVYSWTALADENGKPTGRSVISHAEGNVWQQLLTELSFIACGSTPLIRKECFDSVGLFDLDLCPAEDWDMWLRIAACYTFAVIKEPLVLYRSNPNSMSKSYLLMWQSACKTIEKALQSVPDNLSSLKNRAYNSLYFYLSWQSIKSGDCQQAKDFQTQALIYIPAKKYSQNNIRLDLTIALVRLIGLHQYQKLLKQMYFIRRSFYNII